MSLSNIIKDFLSANSISGQVICGFSGGADSVALLLGLQAAKLQILAVHCHHGLRGTAADDDAEWCRQFCQQRQIDFQLVHLDVRGQCRPREGLEAAGRRLRLQCWKKLCQDRPTPVFLGHHADDALEDLFLKLARGANTTGLTGMRPVRNWDGVKLCRPLLNVRRREIEAFLRHHQILDWRQDASNEDNVFRRNAVRNQLLPMFRDIFQTDAGLMRALQNLRLDAAALEETAAQQYPQTLSDWQALSPAIRVRVLQELLPAGQTFSHRALTAINRTLTDTVPADLPVTVTLNRHFALHLTAQGSALIELAETNKKLQVSMRQWDWRAQPRLYLPEVNGALQATVAPAVEVNVELPVAIPNAPYREIFALASMPSLLTIRGWQAGDRMVPFGRRSAKKLQDIFTDENWPRTQRQAVPVILADEEIIWVPAVKRAAYGKVQEDTAHVVVLTWQWQDQEPRK